MRAAFLPCPAHLDLLQLPLLGVDGVRAAPLLELKSVHLRAHAVVLPNKYEHHHRRHNHTSIISFHA